MTTDELGWTQMDPDEPGWTRMNPWWVFCLFDFSAFQRELNTFVKIPLKKKISRNFEKNLDQLLKYPRKTVTWGTLSNQSITVLKNHEIRKWVWLRGKTRPEHFKKFLLKFSALSEVELWSFWFKKVDFDDVLSTSSEPAFGTIDLPLLRLYKS